MLRCSGVSVRFLLGVVLIDAAIAAGAVVAGRPAHPVAGAPTGGGGGSSAPDHPSSSGGPDPVELGKRVAALYLDARKATQKTKKLILDPPRRVGQDVEIRVEIRGTSSGQLGFPAGLYCPRCAAQRCQFDAGSAPVFDALADAFPVADVKAILDFAGKDGATLQSVGGASSGQMVKKEQATECDADNQPQIEARMPAAFDVYDAADCGVHICAMSGSGEMITVGGGPIDDNRKLACLRAMCLVAGTPIADLPVGFVGDLSFEQGGVYRGAAVVVTIKNLDKDRYAKFWETLEGAIQ
jgi:hypothetical protein